MEGTVYDCHGSTHMGFLMAVSKILFNCDNLTVVDIWAKGSTKSPEIMVLYGYYIFVLCVITLLLVFNTSLALKTKLLMPFSIFKTLLSGN